MTFHGGRLTPPVSALVLDDTVDDGIGRRESEHSPITVLKRGYRVRLNGADHQWGKDPHKEVVG